VVTGSLLPYKAQYQRLANQLPSGSVLICLPSTEGPQRKALRIAAVLLEAEGHRVKVVEAAPFSQRSLTPTDPRYHSAKRQKFQPFVSD